MAAPPVIVRIIPIAARLDDGFQSVIAFQRDPAIAVYEKTVQPPDMDGGDAIVTTTMLNCIYETMGPQRLIKFGDIVIVAAYATVAIPDLRAMINVPQAITIAYPDSAAWSFWAYLRKVESAALTKGTQPEMTLTITITNWDPVNCVEASPSFQYGTGSCGLYEPPLCQA